MFISAMQTYAVVIIIAAIAVQYAFALFCLLKLAYLDITKKEYVLWNLFILIVFFIGGIAFLVYYSKVKDTKSIKAADKVERNAPDEVASDSAENDGGNIENDDEKADADGTSDGATETPDSVDTDGTKSE